MSDENRESQPQQNKGSVNWLTTSIAVLTLVVSITALVPAFLSLQKTKPKVVYDIELKKIEAPELVDEKLFESFLKENKIPPETLVVRLKNIGKAAAEVTKISVETPSSIVRYGWNPRASSNPIWVELDEGKDFGDTVGVEEIKSEARSFAPSKLLEFIVGYQNSDSNTPTVEVFSDGLSAERITDISEAKTESAFRPFILPIAVFGFGFLLTAIVVFIRLLLRSLEYRKLLESMFSSVFRDTIKSLLDIIT